MSYFFCCLCYCWHLSSIKQFFNADLLCLYLQCLAPLSCTNVCLLKGGGLPDLFSLNPPWFGFDEHAYVQPLLTLKVNTLRTSALRLNETMSYHQRNKDGYSVPDDRRAPNDPIYQKTC